MRVKYAALCVMLALALTAAGAYAQKPWLVAPPFDVQRDVFWDFEAGVEAPPLYLGPDDSLLMMSDFVDWQGLNILRGAVGINNLSGNETMYGEFLIHLDNWQRTYPRKLIWMQADGYMDAGGIWLDLAGPQGSVDWWTEAYQYDETTGWFTQTIAAVIVPNPYWEQFVFNFAANPGGMLLVDNVRIATACVVPEPGLISVIGLGLGLVGMVIRRRK
jgi:hypothetical protein